MKKVLLTLLTVLSLLGTLRSQATITYQNCYTEPVRPYTPAPCSIAGNGTATSLWMIQIGAYMNTINPEPGTIMIATNPLFRYYLAYWFTSKERAEEFMITSKIKDKYCDAIVVPFPFVGVIGYQ